MPAGSWGSNSLLVIASSARALAASGRRGGYEIAALDLFGDEDLAEVAFAFERVARARTGGFKSQDLIAAANRVAPAFGKPRGGLVYGSGFEDRPELLAELAKGRRLLGNSPNVIARCKNPVGFSAILGELGLRHPEIRLERPQQLDGWLVKRTGGSGGIHIHAARNSRPNSKIYYQRLVAGTPVSALVLANGCEAKILGLSEQWTAPSSATPFRFGGAAAPAALGTALQRQIADAALQLAQRLELVGLTSVDFIADIPRGEFSVIEVNPRPGATLDVYERLLGVSLLDLHVRACCGEMPSISVARGRPRAVASVILYTKEETIFPPGFPWPEWAADRPKARIRIKTEEPICTVFGEGPTARDARKAAHARSKALRVAIEQCMQSCFARAASLREKGGTTVRKRDS